MQSKSKKIIYAILGEVEFFYNHCLHQNMSMSYFLTNIASKFTLTQMITRNAFDERLKRNQPIAIHELIVPMLQGMDSVHLVSEIKIGGQDQLFNFQVKRVLQEQHGQNPQVCVLMPIINGTDGRKMSKSYNNCIYLSQKSVRIDGLSFVDENYILKPRMILNVGKRDYAKII